MISVIIPCYNDWQSLEKNINSLLLFAEKIDGEIIIINDGSTDNLMEHIKKINNPHLTYLEQKNQGVSSARNKGILHAKKDKLLFLDSDDYINYEQLANYLEEINNFDLIYWDTKKIFPNKKNIIYKTNKEKDIRDLAQSLLYRKYYLFIGSFIISKKIAKKVMFNINYKYGEDLKFIYECINNICSFTKINNVYLFYIQRNNSAMYTFSNKRFDSIKALESISTKNNFFSSADLEHTIKKDKKIIINSFIRSFSLINIPSKRKEFLIINFIIKDIFGKNKIVSEIKFFLYLIIYKLYLLRK
ncbi:glycosyltransferase family 2 protein [Proteus terrae]|uniref:glycosyltransferase family 2 protein n=1 Tax=Proteus terrae TaxID=1574161 RepID=UPI0013307FB1|nr:glycosyltransferase [Proteus terrae]QKD71060.1 glycosyltransferase [Proteus terrae subsp. cibarius]QKD72887.1 glycosyltransferase [Proteus terrae subsp. cibarius]UDF26028.1 glycosyltransferase [Proteus terrae subsp. cibarius]WCG86957.1 glycosyltransferase [Proteus terrae]